MCLRATRHGKAFLTLLVSVLCLCDISAAPCPNCSSWEGKEFHDAKATRMGRCKKGIIPKGCVPLYNKSEDYCLDCRMTVPYNSPSSYRACPRCFGRAEVRDKPQNVKPKTEPTENTEIKTVQEEKEQKPSVDKSIVFVGVKKCDTCDENGKVAPVVDCALCENGFNHIKRGNSYTCRVCGKACASRFVACCKYDCPKCSTARETKAACTFCGGDKIITPLEEMKNKGRMEAAHVKQ